MTRLRVLAARLAQQPWLRVSTVAILKRMPGVKSRLTAMLFSPPPRALPKTALPAPQAVPAITRLPEGARQVHGNLERALAARRARQPR
jgi:hypothetical protein